MLLPERPGDTATAEVLNLVEVGRVLVEAARARTESRGTHARVDQLAAHHDVRLGLCREAVRSDPLTAFSVAHELPWTRHEMHLDDLDLFNVALAVLETRAHLELLAARGEVTVSSSPEGLLYRCR